MAGMTGGFILDLNGIAQKSLTLTFKQYSLAARFCPLLCMAGNTARIFVPVKKLTDQLLRTTDGNFALIIKNTDSGRRFVNRSVIISQAFFA